MRCCARDRQERPGASLAPSAPRGTFCAVRQRNHHIRGRTTAQPADPVGTPVNKTGLILASHCISPVSKAQGGRCFGFQNSCYIEQHITGVLKFEYESSRDCTITTNPIVQLENWHESAYRYYGSQSDLWISHQHQGAGTCPKPYTGNGDLHVGGNDNLDTPFNGRIDSVRIMNRSLEPDEFLHFPMASWKAGAVQ